jgi:predicted aconitase/predicted aconitase with swiveling domain
MMATTMTVVVAGRSLVASRRQPTEPCRVVVTTVPLSFWGGIDFETGQIIDATHPLCGECITDTIFCVPSGRGSCTASQVLLELCLRKTAPRAIVLRDLDGLLSVGAIVADQVFDCDAVPDIVQLDQDFDALLQEDRAAHYGLVVQNRVIVLGATPQEVLDQAAVVTTREEEPIVLSPEERLMMQSATSQAQLLATRILIRYAHLVAGSSRTYVDIAAVHVDACTYIGPGGLQLARRLQGGTVAVPTTLNAGSCDRQNVDNTEYAQQALALGDAYLGLGCQPTFTCAPYLLYNDTKFHNQDLCWGESNAVVYANSVWGARTEKYADYLDLCCALVGKTVATGVHLYRQPQILLDATNVLNEIAQTGPHQNLDSLFPVLGYLCGTLSDGKIPLLLGFQHHQDWSITRDNLKAFCAAFGTTGTSPLIHIAGVTPEAKEKLPEYLEACRTTRVIHWDDLQETYATLDAASDQEDIHLVAVGNPHLSQEECATLATLVEGRTLKRPLVACMARSLYQDQPARVTRRLHEFGVQFIHDTCWCMLLDPPVIPPQGSIIVTNSGKYAHYGPSLTQRQFRFASLEDCVTAAVTGKVAAQKRPAWFGARRSFATWGQVLRRVVK